MLKGLITFALVLLLTTSIFSQIDAKGGGFRGGIGGFGDGGGAKSFSSNSIPLGTGQGKMFTSSPSGKISPQESAQGPKQTESSSSIKSDLERNRQSQPSQQQQQPNSQFQQPQPRSNFFGGGLGGFGGGLGGFGNMLMSSIMGNFIGQALFGWMFPHPSPMASVTPHSTQQMINHNNSSSNNSTIKK